MNLLLALLVLLYAIGALAYILYFRRSEAGSARTHRTPVPASRPVVGILSDDIAHIACLHRVLERADFIVDVFASRHDLLHAASLPAVEVLLVDGSRAAMACEADRPMDALLAHVPRLVVGNGEAHGACIVVPYPTTAHDHDVFVATIRAAVALGRGIGRRGGMP